ncbi:unnamed protein product [Euphydryas editha]|uniref:Lipase n=1 Tax=Euphydryas editha TaxID=104508 RepID=A0AAU9UC15_EUPED|nr:unnamed protein product [Euphydryas editha]
MKHIIVTIPLIVMIGIYISSFRHNKAMNFTQIATGLGYPVQEYYVVTQDGYILKLFHIPGDRSKPILLMHGIIDSADTFIIRGKTSLSVGLADAGYDVWLGNSRGNRYSRRHLSLDPNIDKEFWDFSFHELGYYDLPAMIDFILDETGVKSLSAVGHSQGNTIFLVLGATRPEYNDKIKVMVSLSPVCYLSNINNAVLYLMNFIPAIDQFYRLIGEEEFLGDDTALIRLYRNICGSKKSYGVCANGIMFSLAGSDPDGMEPDFFPTVVKHYPTGTSKKNVIHVSQIGLRRSFAKFDYGCKNIEVYNSSKPPEYDLGKVSMKVVLLVGRNDEISRLEDVRLLESKLPNVVNSTILKHEKFNHIDAVWGRNMSVYLFPYIFDILSKYG